MFAAMTYLAQPYDLQRFAVVGVVSVYLSLAAALAWLANMKAALYCIVGQKSHVYFVLLFVATAVSLFESAIYDQTTRPTTQIRS
jgi:hypothetical protein